MGNGEGLIWCCRFILEALCWNLLHLGIRKWELHPKYFGTWCIQGLRHGSHGGYFAPVGNSIIPHPSRVGILSYKKSRRELLFTRVGNTPGRLS